jgi:hypothetical protein
MLVYECFMLYFYRVEIIPSTKIIMKNVVVLDNELYLKSIEKSPVLISEEDIENNIQWQREAVAELCGKKWYEDELCVI